jgi:signal peptidase I
MALTSTRNNLQPKKSLGGLKRVFAALIILLVVATPTVLQSYFGFGISPVLSGSMSPFAQPGDAFITVKRPVSQLSVGDIVTLQLADSRALYAHRIIEVRELSGGIKRIVTKGDANPTAEENPFMASPQTMVPVTIFSVKWIGYVLVYLTSAQGRQAGLALIVIANVLMLLLSLFKKPAKKISSSGQNIYRGLYKESSENAINEKKKKEIYRDLYEQTHWKQQAIKEK